MEWIIIIAASLFLGLIVGVCLDTKRELKAYQRGKRDGFREGQISRMQTAWTIEIK